MYEKKLDCSVNPQSKQPEHIKIAKDMAAHICEFNPDFQFEMVYTIRDYVSIQLKILIEETEKRLYNLSEISGKL
jgi:hypothetical protein